MGRPSSSLFKTKIYTRKCSTRYLGDVQQRVNEKKKASIKILKEKTLGCFEFFLLYTLDCVPGLLVGRQSSAWMTNLFYIALPSYVSSCLSFFMSPSTLSIQQTSIPSCCVSTMLNMVLLAEIEEKTKVQNKNVLECKRTRKKKWTI